MNKKSTIDELRDAIFDTTRPTKETTWLIMPTPIGPVMFGSDGTMKYGDNFATDVPSELRKEVASALKKLTR